EDAGVERSRGAGRNHAAPASGRGGGDGAIPFGRHDEVRPLGPGVIAEWRHRAEGKDEGTGREVELEGFGRLAIDGCVELPREDDAPEFVDKCAGERVGGWLHFAARVALDWEPAGFGSFGDGAGPGGRHFVAPLVGHLIGETFAKEVGLRREPGELGDVIEVRDVYFGRDLAELLLDDKFADEVVAEGAVRHLRDAGHGNAGD